MNVELLEPGLKTTFKPSVSLQRLVLKLLAVRCAGSTPVFTETTSMVKSKCAVKKYSRTIVAAPFPHRLLFIKGRSRRPERQGPQHFSIYRITADFGALNFLNGHIGVI
jgi:hypothetical protein